MMGMSPRLICCSCSPVPPPLAAPPMAAFHAEKSSRPSACRYSVLRPERSESELTPLSQLQGSPRAKKPRSTRIRLPRDTSRGQQHPTQTGPLTREVTLRKWAVVQQAWVEGVSCALGRAAQSQGQGQDLPSCLHQNQMLFLVWGVSC